jgi:ArsR family transcriptional regulator
MKNEVTAEMEKLFFALADKTRLRLLNIMREREVNVNAFVEITGESQPKISRHLAFLKNAGIVEIRRDGKWIYYKIAQPASLHAAHVLRDALDWMNSHNEIRRENEKFSQPSRLPEQSQIEKDAPPKIISAKTNIKEKQELEIYLL